MRACACVRACVRACVGRRVGGSVGGCVRAWVRACACVQARCAYACKRAVRMRVSALCGASRDAHPSSPARRSACSKSGGPINCTAEAHTRAVRGVERKWGDSWCEADGTEG
eukprot:1832912-Pleurochrysis_carterae.AAC.1